MVSNLVDIGEDHNPTLKAISVRMMGYLRRVQ